MPMGPGKYDHWCTLVREGTHADGVVLIVLNGDRGAGFSVQAVRGMQVPLADMLEDVVQQLRKNEGKAET